MVTIWEIDSFVKCDPWTALLFCGPQSASVLAYSFYDFVVRFNVNKS